jgi:hypothetical protein
MAMRDNFNVARRALIWSLHFDRAKGTVIAITVRRTLS